MEMSYPAMYVGPVQFVLHVMSRERGLLTALLLQSLALITISRAVALSPSAWIVGIAYGLIMAIGFSRGLARSGAHKIGAANWVTLVRATLVGAVAGLVAQSFVNQISVPMLVGLSSFALVLDAADGQVARRTGSASKLGARFDMETDASLILILSIYVSANLGWWVLAIGLARYLFVAAAVLAPWMQRQLPARLWRKGAAAIVGIVLTVAASNVLHERANSLLVATALLMCAESFGRDIYWLYRRRNQEFPEQATASSNSAVLKDYKEVTLAKGKYNALIQILNFAAILLIVLILAAPNSLNRFSISTIVRLPIEFIAILGLALVVTRPWRNFCVAVIAILLVLLTILKLADIGFEAGFGRTFDPASDLAYFNAGIDLLTASLGRSAMLMTLLGSIFALISLTAVTFWAVWRTFNLASRFTQVAKKSWTSLAISWVILALLGANTNYLKHTATADSTRIFALHGEQLVMSVGDQHNFAQSIKKNSLSKIPDDQLLQGLRGKDVLVVFVESYGKVALQNPRIFPGVTKVLDNGTRRLKDAGFSARSSWLTSPTFGGISWLAHATLQSGLWINSQKRHDQLLQTNHKTLFSTFHQAGWRTVSFIPPNNKSWIEGKRFYKFDAAYNSLNVRYQGPRLGYARMPDQYSLEAFRRLELARANRPPVMAEIDLSSSHTPWTPVPQMVALNQVGDGSIFNSMAEKGVGKDSLWRDPKAVQVAYGQSIEYSLNTIISFVENLNDPNLVLVMLGDHPPATIVSGPSSGHDVPITIIAHDTKVIARLNDWKWQNGMRPRLNTPAAGMDTFRNRFIFTFSGDSRSRPN